MFNRAMPGMAVARYPPGEMMPNAASSKAFAKSRQSAKETASSGARTREPVHSAV